MYKRQALSAAASKLDALPAIWTTESTTTLVEPPGVGSTGCTGIETMGVVVAVGKRSAVADCGDEKLSAREVRAAAAAAALGVLTCTVIIVVPPPGESTKVSETNETATPSWVAIAVAISVRCVVV